ncbi:hypothetical protein MSAN_00081000 [Mycena sanguinolenta]|uniref:HIT-type domain-containing protein n=1 Tax=Mycena sanguinolenta TaxID=230812 RepID=A0A8H6ZFV1_9AGAR|nr:hypothetical protein MSAN_00081000 [Mycena sanguinolenta]
MAPKTRRGKCQICDINESKYTCSGCAALYCSVPCYKKHKEVPCTPEKIEDSNKIEDSQPDPLSAAEPPLADPNVPPLRPLTSLKWPYVPEASAYPDPLKRDDPKTLQIHQYEAIATSPAIRTTLATHPNLPALLTSIDKLRGPDREHALQRALGVTAPDIVAPHGTELSEDVLALRALAEVVEAAVRGQTEGALGLDWGGE